MSPMPTLPDHVSLCISYRPASDVAWMEFEDEAMASFIEHHGGALRQVPIDYDTLVECADVQVGGESRRLVVGVQIIGANSRHRAGLVHDSLPSDVRRHFLGLVSSSHTTSHDSVFDALTQMRVSAVVPVTSLVCSEPRPATRPLHEVKSVVAALGDLAAVLHSLPRTSWADTLSDDHIDDLVVLSALVYELAVSLDLAQGMSTPALGSRIVAILDQSAAVPASVRCAMRESVMRLCDTDDWSISARDLREVAQTLKNLRP